MLTWIGGVALLVVAILVAQLVSLRIGWEPGMTAIRRFNRRFMNPRQMRTAGKPGAYAGVIHHVGRTSGNRYETPVGVKETDDALVIGLPYGTSPDWLKNVLAAGTAEVVHEGRTIRVEDPQVLSETEVISHPGRGERFLQRLYGVGLALRLVKSDARG